MGNRRSLGDRQPDKRESDRTSRGTAKYEVSVGVGDCGSIDLGLTLRRSIADRGDPHLGGLSHSSHQEQVPSHKYIVYLCPHNSTPARILLLRCITTRPVSPGRLSE